MTLRHLTSVLAGLCLAVAGIVGASWSVHPEIGVLAQGRQLRVVGTVVDTHLAPVVGATVAFEQGGRAMQTALSGPDGAFRLSVAPGDYVVRIAHEGFERLARQVHLGSGSDVVRLPFVLQSSAGDDDKPIALGRSGGQPSTAPVAVPGSSASSVQVTAEAPLIQAQSGERSFAVNSMSLDNQPISRGHFTSLTAMTPTIVNGSPVRYAHVEPGTFHRAIDDPLSTFGADVDTASFANVRRFLQHGQVPPTDAVRVEEFINYFRYPYPTPASGHPIGVVTEIGDCPWAPGHKLVLIGAKAVPSSTREIEGRNIVLLIDVSGSMMPAERLPLLKAAFRLFVDTLRPDDRLAIVTYAGAAGVALPSTPARQRDTILAAIDRLGAGGSTNGAEGIVTAYRVAREHYVPGGVNRVILATDGDFNVGVVGHDALLHLIERQKESGIFLSVFGVGTDNLQDATMEMLADKGNGNYAYLDSLQEARRVLVTEADSTLETVAKEVKFQVEFNPARVAAWKQIGYENRVMAAADFNDDRKDGGELGAGHAVTVLYEVVPVGASDDNDDGPGRARVDPLKYQNQDERPAPPRPSRVSSSPEWLTVKVRYQAPEGEQSRLIQQAVTPTATQRRPSYLPLVSAVAEFGLLLRDSHPRTERWTALAQRLDDIRVPDALRADRDQLVELVALAKALRRE